MAISRRKFLKYGLATAAVGMAGVAVSPLVRKLLQGEEEKPITFYVSLRPDTQYTQESFDLARQYFQERVGLNVNFVYSDKAPELNHLNKFALIEQTPEERAYDFSKTQKSQELTKKEVDSIIKDKAKRIEKLQSGEKLKSMDKLGVPNVTNMTDEEIDEWIKKEEKELYDWAGKEREKFYKRTSGEADLENSSVYLMPINQSLISYFKGKKGFDKIAAGLIVHEIGHIAGLWHSFQYANDKIEDKVNDKTNVMSYDLPGEGRFGFDMTPEQIQQMRDYFRGGEAYQRLQKHDFNLDKFTDEIAKERGYK